MILYVEDDLVVADIWARTLQYAGYEVIVIRTPDQALETVELMFSELNAIITDVMLPVGHVLDPVEAESGLRTGFVLIGKIRQLYEARKHQCPPIIVITIRNTYTEDLEGMNVTVVSKRTDSPERVLEILDKLGIEPHHKPKQQKPGKVAD